MKNIRTKIRLWWFARTEGEKAFYKINTPMQIFLLLFPGLWLSSELGSRITNGWYNANPELFNALVIPTLVGWVGFMFLARWILGWILYFTYQDDDSPLYFQEDNDDLDYSDLER